MLHIFNIFRENDGKENCAQVLEEECIKMFGTKYLNDEHDCNVVSMWKSCYLLKNVAMFFYQKPSK